MSTDESAASLIGSDSALVIREKPPLPKFSRVLSRGDEERSQQPPDGMDTDDPRSRSRRKEKTAKKGKRSVLRGALNFFRTSSR